MDRYGTKREWTDICIGRKCGYEIWSKGMERRMEKCLKESKEGRTYIWSCATKRGRCIRSGYKIDVCHECATNQAKRWYRLGKRDMLKKLKRARETE